MLNLFIIVRILDILTTLYGISLGRHELNPLVGLMITSNKILFILIQLTIIYIIVRMYKYSILLRTAISIFTILNAIIVSINIILILLTIFNI